MNCKSRKMFIGVFLLTFIAGPAAGQAGQNDVQKSAAVNEADAQALGKLLKQMAGARSARVVLGNMALRSWRNTLDPDNPVSGCTYLTKDAAKIASLAALIHQHVNLQKGAWGMGEAKELISFEIADAEKIDLWLPGSWEYDRMHRSPDEPLEVRIFRNLGGKRTLLRAGAKPAVIRALYEWAVGVDSQNACAFVTAYLRIH